MYEHVSEVKESVSSPGQLCSFMDYYSTIIQTALDEEANGTKLSSVNSWNNLVDLVVDDDTECRLTDDDQFLSTATYASSALLNKDFGPTCDYLSDGQGDSTPITSSTLWVLEIDPEMSEPERKSVQVEIRNMLEEFSSESELNYGVVSLDLLSNDIDNRTLDNLALLVILALIVVILLLIFTFSSFRNVMFPLVGLSYALIWTYGILNSFDIEFSALEVAVAPLVLGLGIDYAIHLQRANSTLREQYDDPSVAWIENLCKIISATFPCSNYHSIGIPCQHDFSTTTFDNIRYCLGFGGNLCFHNLNSCSRGTTCCFR